jgi:dihydroorotate dehydrogenase
MLLNASGCLDALTAPDTARQLDAFVTKTITPQPRAGNEPVRIAEVERGMLNSIGLANPGRDWFLAEVLPRLRDLGVPLWVSVGGYSGPALGPIALACVYACRRATSLPIVGMGGVATGEDALALIACGASAVAVGTALFSDPDAPARIRDELAALAAERGFGSPAEARDAAHESVVATENDRPVAVQKALQKR